MIVENPVKLIKAQFEGDNLHVQHVQNTIPAQAISHQIRTYSNNGWTEKKHFRRIGSIPIIEFLNHPEFYDDDKAIERYLKSDAGCVYRTVNRI